MSSSLASVVRLEMGRQLCPEVGWEGDCCPELHQASPGLGLALRAEGTTEVSRNLRTKHTSLGLDFVVLNLVQFAQDLP